MEGLEKVVSPAWVIACAENKKLHGKESCMAIKCCPPLWSSLLGKKDAGETAWGNFIVQQLDGSWAE